MDDLVYELWSRSLLSRGRALLSGDKGMGRWVSTAEIGLVSSATTLGADGYMSSRGECILDTEGLHGHVGRCGDGDGGGGSGTSIGVVRRTRVGRRGGGKG